MRFWIPHCGFQIPSAGLRILPVQIPHSKTQNIPDFSFWFAHNFYIPFSRNDFNGKFHNWRTCCVNACLSIHISITTFDNYKKHITANQGINFSSTNTYWDCPFIPHIFNNSEWAYHISFIEIFWGSSSDLAVSKELIIQIIAYHF